MGGLSAHIREERIHLEREEESALTTGKITNMKGIARRWLINSVGVIVLILITLIVILLSLIHI